MRVFCGDASPKCALCATTLPRSNSVAFLFCVSCFVYSEMDFVLTAIG